MSIRMRKTRSKTGHGRSHHGLSEARLSQCSKCKAMHLRHRLCTNCGTYRGREYIDVLAKEDKKARKAKERELAEQGQVGATGGK